MSNNLVNQSTKAISTNELRWIGPVLAVVSSGPMDLFFIAIVENGALTWVTAQAKIIITQIREKTIARVMLPTDLDWFSKSNQIKMTHVSMYNETDAQQDVIVSFVWDLHHEVGANFSQVQRITQQGGNGMSEYLQMQLEGVISPERLNYSPSYALECVQKKGLASAWNSIICWKKHKPVNRERPI